MAAGGLFDTPGELEWLELGRSKLGYCADFVTEHANLYHELCETLPWEQPEVSVYGKRHKVPRLTAFYGDKGVAYRYSGHSHSAPGWPATLHSLKERIDTVTQTGFNTVLLNWYRDGSDTMGFHADDEAELGLHPVIASLSLGGDRRFVIKRRDNNKIRHELVLQGGSLLIMAGRFQAEWLHAVPKDARANKGRINLTFRQVLS